jgi:arylsulfatase A-like enzyme
MVEQFDQQMGRIMAYLNDPNGDGDTSDSITSNTLVIFFSDNGGEEHSTSNYPLRGAKGMFTEGGIREPLIASMPGTIPAGTTNNTPVIMVDFYKTFADFVGAKLPNPVTDPLDGVSLMPLLRDQVQTLPDRALYWHFPGYLDHRARPCSMIVKPFDGKRYKLLYFYETKSWSLYNLTDDLGENSDLFASAGQRARYWPVAENLSAHLRQWLDQTHAIYPAERATGAVVPPPAPLSGSPDNYLQNTP